MASPLQGPYVPFYAEGEYGVRDEFRATLGYIVSSGLACM